MKQPKMTGNLDQEAEAFDSQIEERILVEKIVLEATEFLYVRRKAC